MRKNYKNAFLHRLLTKRKTVFLNTALAMLSLTAITEKAHAQALINEDFSGQTLPTGWDTTDVSGSTLNWVFDNPGNRTIGGGFDSDFIIFDSDEFGGSPNTNLEEATIETPAFDVSAATGVILLSFDNSFRDYILGVSEGNVEVWDGSVWTNVLTITGANDGYPSANSKTIDITSACGGSSSAKVRFRWANGDWDYWWAIDNVLVQEITCFWPSNVTASVVGDITATINWDAPGVPPTDGYEYYYNTTGTAPTAATPAEGTATDTFAELSGLTANTLYSVWVRSICSTSDQSDWSAVGTFTTSPNMQTPATLPYTEDFTSTGGNWTILNGTEVNEWFIDDVVGNTGNSLYISNNDGTSHAYSTGSSSVVQAFRDITFPAGTNPFGVSFDFICNGEGFTSFFYDYFRVWMVPIGYVPTPGTQIAPGAGRLNLSGNVNNVTTWTNRNYMLSDTFGGSTWRLVFEWRNDGSSGAQPPAAIDNINVYEITCMGPSELAVDNVDDDNVDISWTPPASAPADGYEYYYNTTGTPPTASTTASGSVGAGVTDANLTGLASLTQYFVWVRSVCSTNDKSIWGAAATFTTLPATQTPATLPYTEDFTSTGGNWTILNGTQVNEWFIDDVVGNTGNSLYISNDDGDSHAYSTGSSSVVQAFRDITFPAGTNPFGVSFDFICNGEGFTTSFYDYFRVWMVPIDYLPTPGTQIATGAGRLNLSGNVNNVTTWTNRNYLLSDTFGGSTWRLVFEWRNDGSSGAQPPAAIDNIYVYEITCAAPTELAIDNIGVDNADLSWTAPANAPADGYEYYYNTTGTAPTENTTASGSVAAGASTATLGGLTDATQYYVWVRSLCSTTDQSSWSTSASFTTLCAAFSTPFIETLNDGSLPSCWTNTTDGTGTSANILWKFSGAPDYGATTALNGKPAGTYAWVDASTPLDDIHAVTLTSPLIDLTGLTTPYVQFEWFKNNTATNGSADNILTVEIREENSASWEVIFSDDTNDPAWRYEGIELAASYQNATIQLRFVVDKDVAGNGDFYDDLLLDNIEVKELPVCAVPTGLATTDIAVNSATANWDGDPDANHLVEYGETGFTPGTGTIVEVGGLSTVLPGLDPNTTYDFYVQLICEDGFVDTSNYSVVETFTTLCNEVMINLGETASICAGSTTTLDAGNAGSTYLWSDNSTDQTLDVSTSGTYTVTVTNTYGCSGSDTVEVIALAPVVVDLGEDITACSGDPIVLDAGNPGSTYQWNTTAVTQTINVTTAGTYVVVVTDDNDCQGTDSINVTIVAAPQAHGITAVYQNDGSYHFTAVSVAHVEAYLWDFGDGTATSDEESPNHTYANSGNYTVTLTVFNDCGNDTTTAGIQARGTSLNELRLDDNQLRVYPNPADHMLTIENNSNFKMQEVMVYNILGQVVYQSRIDNEKQYQLNVSSFSSGIYQIRLKMNEGFLSRKFEVIK